LTITALIANPSLRRTGSQRVVHGLLQILLATEVTLGRQDGGVPQKELYLLQFTAIHMAELCAGAPEIMRGEVVEL
jgi:hypothetical protein